jgi:uncharacterized protein (DUF885 family)
MHSAAGSAAPVKTADQRLRELYEAEWEWRGEQFARPSDEEERPADHFPKVDAASQEARIAYWRKALASLDAIPAAQLSPEEKINGAVFRTSLEAFIAEGRFRTWEMPLNSHSQFWSGLETRSPLRDAAAYRRYLDKLRDLPRYFDEQTVNMRAGLKRGFSVSRVTLDGRDKSIEAFTDADPQKSPFRPFFSALPTCTNPLAREWRLF